MFITIWLSLLRFVYENMLLHVKFWLTGTHESFLRPTDHLSGDIISTNYSSPLFKFSHLCGMSNSKIYLFCLMKILFNFLPDLSFHPCDTFPDLLFTFWSCSSLSFFPSILIFKTFNGNLPSFKPEMSLYNLFLSFINLSFKVLIFKF